MVGFFERRRLRKALEELEKAGAGTFQDVGQRLEHAQLFRAVHGDAASLPLFDALVADHPEDDRIRYIPASIRVENDDPAGAEALEALCARNLRLSVHGYHALIHHYDRSGKDADVNRIASLMRANEEKVREAEAQSKTLTPDTDFGPPVYDARVRSELKAEFGTIRGLDWAMAASRVRSLYGDDQQVILFQAKDGRTGARVAEAIATVLPVIDMLIWQSEPDNFWLQERMKTIEGAQIYP
jgi:hypothetical protein